MSSVTAQALEAERAAMEEQVELRLYLYLVFGGLAVLANIPIIVVFFSTREMRRKFVLFQFLAFADFINGISVFMAGFFRLRILASGEYYLPITASQCLVTYPWPVLFVIAAWVCICLAVERLVAVFDHAWYRRVWGHRHKFALGVFSVLLTLLGLGAAFLVQGSTINEDRLCNVCTSTTQIYCTVHYLGSSLGFLLSFVILSAVYHQTRNMSSKTYTAQEKQRQRLILFIAGISVVFVAIPSLLLVLEDYGVPINVLLIGVCYCLYAFASCLNLPLYIVYRPDFRRQLLGLVGVRQPTRSLAVSQVSESRRTTTPAVSKGFTVVA